MKLNSVVRRCKKKIVRANVTTLLTFIKPCKMEKKSEHMFPLLNILNLTWSGYNSQNLFKKKKKVKLLYVAPTLFVKYIRHIWKLCEK